MPSIGTVECYYHPDKVNASWCVKCGKPICHQCNKHSIFVYSGYSICPPCKSKYINLVSIVMIAFFSGLSIIMTIVSGFTYFIVWLIFAIGGIVVFIVVFSLKESEYNRWIKTVDEYQITREAIPISVHKHDLIPCDFHPNAPSIGRCDECRSEICVECSRVKGRTRYSPAQFLCMGHYWAKMRKLFLIVSIILLVAGLLPTILVAILAPPSGYYNPIPTMLFALTLPLLILFGGFFAYYTKLKWDYYHWNAEVGFDLK